MSKCQALPHPASSAKPIPPKLGPHASAGHGCSSARRGRTSLLEPLALSDTCRHGLRLPCSRRWRCVLCRQAMANIRVNPETRAQSCAPETFKDLPTRQPRACRCPDCALNPPGLAHFGPLRARPGAFSGPFLGRPMAFENPIPFSSAAGGMRSAASTPWQATPQVAMP